MTQAEALLFLKAAFLDCYEEENDDALDRRVIDNEPFFHPRVAGWCYRPAQDRVEPRPDWDGGSLEWQAKYPTGMSFADRI
jgi:hypothetical protein